jgi:hypothetical protein
MTLGVTPGACTANWPYSNLIQAEEPIGREAVGNLSRRETVEQRMKLNDAARDLIGKGADATLVTLNPDGSP